MSTFIYILMVTLVFELTYGCTTEPYCSQGPYGIREGHEFNDFDLFKHTSLCSNITRIEVWYNDILQGLRLTYGSSASPLRGSNEGTHANHYIEETQWITKVTGQVGQTPAGSTARITELAFHLNDGTVHGPYGGQGLEQTAFEAKSVPESAAGLSWISGRDGANIDLLTFFFNCII